MIYLTYNDAPSGIYSGQVIDVCRFLNTELNAKIRLVSLISLRGFWGNRKKIKAEMPDALVLPMFPGVGNWSMNVVLLFVFFLFFGKQSVIARGPFAASLALKLKKIKLIQRVCFDARGAYEAEFNEYNVAGNLHLNKEIGSIEKNVLRNSDFRIAVSQALVEYWKERFNYHGEDHTVIPCTLNTAIFRKETGEGTVPGLRPSLGFSEEDIICVYSGASSGWQSLQLADDLLLELMRSGPKVKALLLTDSIPAEMKIMQSYPERVKVKWVSGEQVADILRSCDYGLLLRENSVTNRVSSPVKFAEYLSVGLPVLISENTGDYTEFVLHNKCGRVIKNGELPAELLKVSEAEKKNCTDLAFRSFAKTNFTGNYKTLLNRIK